MSATVGNIAMKSSRRAELSVDRPRVCQLVHGLPVGGAEVLVDRIIRRLRDRYEFVVACLDQIGQLGELLVEDGVRVGQLERSPGFDWKCVRRLHQLLQVENVQIVHAHQCTPFAYALATRAFGRRPPVLLTEHGRFFPDAPSRKRKLFHRLLTRPEDRFVAVGQTVRQALVDNEGLPADRIEVVYNGVDRSPEEMDAIDCRQVRSELGVAEGECLVVQVARLDAIKDHNTALKAIATATCRDRRVRFVIVGDGPERAAIEREIEKLGLRQCVSMLGMRSDVRRLLAAADVFLLTSVSEGIPVTVLEAMAAGVPVVSTAVGGVPELIVHNESGLLAPVGDAAQLSEALVRLAGDVELRARLSRNAQRRVANHFSEHAMLDHYDRIYQNILACRAK